MMAASFAAGLLLALAGAAWWVRRHPAVGQRAVLNVRPTGGSEFVFEGVLSYRAPWFVVREAVLVEPGAAPRPVDGEVVLAAQDIVFVQVPERRPVWRRPFPRKVKIDEPQSHESRAA